MQPQSLQRYEMKYVVAQSMVGPIRAYLRPYVRLDHFAPSTTEFRYPITSVYLDSPDLSLAASTLAGDRNRTKLRIRSYTRLGREPQPDHAVFLEIKQKRSATIHKRRTRMTYSVVRRLVLGDPDPQAQRHAAGTDPVAHEFFQLCRLHRAEPIANVHYEREAYESRMGDDVRITLDVALATSPAGRGAWFDAAGRQDVPVRGVILEIKFSGAVPRWTAAFVRHFDLRNRSVPKYVLCVQKAGGAEMPHVGWIGLSPSRRIV